MNADSTLAPTYDSQDAGAASGENQFLDSRTTVTINEKQYPTRLDSGSDFSLMREKFASSLGLPTAEISIYLRGFTGNLRRITHTATVPITLMDRTCAITFALMDGVPYPVILSEKDLRKFEIGLSNNCSITITEPRVEPWEPRRGFEPWPPLSRDNIKKWFPRLC